MLLMEVVVEELAMRDTSRLVGVQLAALQIQKPGRAGTVDLSETISRGEGRGQEAGGGGRRHGGGLVVPDAQRRLQQRCTKCLKLCGPMH